MQNPYMQTTKGGSAPLITRIPIHDFDDAHHMESELLPYEACIARIENKKATGFTHNIALVYKDDIGKVYSCQLMQHHGELKNTPENAAILEGNMKEEKVDNGGSETESMS